MSGVTPTTEIEQEIELVPLSPHTTHCSERIQPVSPEPLVENRRLSFFDDYEYANGVPTYVMRPDAQREFTCYALSEDGKLFATGDSGGGIRLWNAANASLIAEPVVSFRQHVDCLSFIDGRSDLLVAVGDGGTLKKFAIEHNSAIAANGRQAFASIELLSNDGTLEDLSNVSAMTAWQISADGRTLACRAQRRGKIVFCVHRVEEVSIVSVIELSCEGQKLTIPVLSPSGRSMMSFIRKRKEQTSSTDATGSRTQDVEVKVAVWKTLHFVENTVNTSEHHHQSGTVGAPAVLDGLLGTWGREGDFLLLWKKSTDDHGLTLEIYKTSDLIPRGSRVFARRTLDRGLLTWDAQILDHCSGYEGLIVAVYESFDLSRRRLLLWNAELDVVCTEVYVPVPAKCLDDVFTEDQAKRWAINEETLDSLLESGMVDGSMSEDRYHSKVANILRPKFAVNSDLTTAVFFSWRFEAVVMVSLTSGATLWQCNLPPSMRSNPLGGINTCRFDKSEGRVMVVGEEAILAFAPSCLATDSRQYSRCLSSRNENGSEVPSVRCCCFAHYRHLPNAAVSAWVSHLLWKASQSDAILNQIPPDIRPGPHQHPDIIDATVSADGQRMAFIARNDESLRVFVTENSPIRNTRELEVDTDVLERLRIINPEDTVLEDFCATQVFLCKSSNENDFLFVEGRLSGRRSVRCYDLVHDTRTAELCTHDGRDYIFNTPCLSSSQTLEGNVLLLDTRQVHVFDFKHLTRTTIPYTSNFATTTSRFDPDKWQSVLKRHRKISDDGKRVLIGWNETTQRCLVITTEMTTECVESMIDVVGEDISFDCAISHDGEWIAYASVHKESDCQLFIGIYKIAEERTMQMLSMDMGPERDELMSSLFFSFSPNGDHIILANCAWEEDQRSLIFLLTPYDADGWFPDERQLRLTVAGNSEETPRCIQEFYEHYGAGICNMPNVAGVSMLEAAFLKRDNLSIQKMQEISKNRGFCLSMSCMLSPVGTDTSMHPLQHIFRKKLLDGKEVMKELISLLCQDHLHINHKSAILKNIFVDVWMRQSDIIKDVLSKNNLIVDICTLHVHEDFFSEEDHMGIHVETADTLMEWNLLETGSHDSVWRDRHRETIGGKRDCEDASTVLGTLKVVCLEDIAQIGREGILRRLLLQDVPDYFYKYDAVKWTIALKWKVFWKERCESCMKGYALVVLLFTVYAWRVGSGGNFQNRKTHDLVVEALLFLPCWFYAFWMLGEEIQQICSLMADGQWFLRSRRRGLSIYFKSKWNWVQLTSCALLLVFIPCFHALAYCYPAHSSTVAVFVGIESILIWFKIWYHAQALKAMGPLVLMINNIIVESLHFLFLALMILMGFSLGLHVMFNHLPANSTVSEYREMADESFGTLPNSMLTLFYALFANFPSELFLLTNNASALITLIFVLYIFLETVVLLNLLIAIMGDTFDRVRSREESQLLKGRAKYIDAGEAALNQRRRIAYQKLIKKYLLALVRDPDESAKSSSDGAGEWSGRIVAIREMMETVFRKQDKRQRAELDELKKTIRRTLGMLVERTEQKENE